MIADVDVTDADLVGRSLLVDPGDALVPCVEQRQQLVLGPLEGAAARVDCAESRLEKALGESPALPEIGEGARL